MYAQGPMLSPFPPVPAGTSSRPQLAYMITLERHANPEMERDRFWTAEIPIGYIT